jgi:hypothetical protein
VQTVESHPSGVAPGAPATSLVASLVIDLSITSCKILIILNLLSSVIHPEEV